MWRSSHTQAAGEGERENQINPTVMVDAGNWHVFHTCQEAWRALTRPIKVYRRAAGPSITMTDRSPPLPLGQCQGRTGSRPQRDWRAERGRAELGGFLWERTGGTSVDLQSHCTAGKCEWMTSWPHTHADFSPLHMELLPSSHVGTIIFTRWTPLQCCTCGKIWIFFEAGLSELATCRLKNYGGYKLILSIFMFSLASLHPYSFYAHFLYCVKMLDGNTKIQIQYSYEHFIYT